MECLGTRKERTASGAAVRKLVPRSSHAGWAPAAGRADPVAVLAAQGTSRIQELLPIRYARMRASPFAFLRGAAAVMAADLAGQPNTGLIVQLCGDAHMANFGSFASPEGQALFDVNDFDETLPGPFEWDVKRLAASLAVCGRDAGMAEKQCRALAASAVCQYRRHMARLARLAPFQVWHSAIDLGEAVAAVDDTKTQRVLRARLHEAVRGHDDYYGLVEEIPGKAHGQAQARIRDRGTTEHIERFAGTMRAIFETYRDGAPPHLTALFRHYRLADAAFKVVGVGSVGTFCALGLFRSADGATLMLQAKEAQASVLEAGAAPSQFPHHGERVVAGQRVMQAEPDIFLGVAPTPIEGKCFYVRRLKDSRLAQVGAILEAQALPFAANLCGRTLARAHARGGDAATLAGYMGDTAGFDTAVAEFAMKYADQSHADWQAFCAALDSGTLSGRADAA